jgi:phage N-6-adenine-methyltransferase
LSLVNFRAGNHIQQVAKRGPLDSVDDRATDPAVFSELHARFRFTVDAAAAPHNAKLPRFWTLHNSGLARSWAGERVWCNPPYSSLDEWVGKASSETSAALIVMLLPANRTEQMWWQTHIEPFRDRGARLRVEFLRGRMRFINSGKVAIGPNERPPFGVCLAIWGL